MATPTTNNLNITAVSADYSGFVNESMNFSGFIDSSIVFEPECCSSMTSAALNARLENIPSEQRSLNFDISEMSEGEQERSAAFDEAMFVFADHSDNPIIEENPQSVTVVDEPESDEDILDISPPFNVVEEE